MKEIWGRYSEDIGQIWVEHLGRPGRGQARAAHLVRVRVRVRVGPDPNPNPNPDQVVRPVRRTLRSQRKVRPRAAPMARASRST